MDPYTEYLIESSLMIAVLVVGFLICSFLLLRLAGINTWRDAARIDKIVRFALLMMNAMVALGAGFVGFVFPLTILAFCDTGPVINCFLMALCIFIVSSLLLLLSGFAIAAMLQKNDHAVWYLKLYPLPLLVLATVMLTLQPLPELNAAWSGLLFHSLLALTYVSALRKPHSAEVTLTSDRG